MSLAHNFNSYNERKDVHLSPLQHITQIFGDSARGLQTFNILLMLSFWWIAIHVNTAIGKWLDIVFFEVIEEGLARV